MRSVRHKLIGTGGRKRPSRTWKDQRGRYCMMVATACGTLKDDDWLTSDDEEVTCPACKNARKHPSKVIRLFIARDGVLDRRVK